MSRCLKITEKVSFNIASEASHVYILSPLEMPKMVNFGKFLNNKVCGQTELPDRSVLIGQKLAKNAKITYPTQKQIYALMTSHISVP